MTGSEIRQKYLNFFKNKKHAVIPSASLIPENDPSTLFTSAGMQPMMPFLLGEAHPLGKRIVNVQKCFRSGDIAEVGDNRHTTCFEMLGNWSLGDYFKKDQLTWVYEFLVDVLKLKKENLSVSVLKGDTEAKKIWLSLGLPESRISEYDETKNWWSRSGVPDNMPDGEPGGPDSEVFYEFDHVKHDPKYGEVCHMNCDCGRFMEIGNSVFMQFQKQNGKLVNLPQKNIDFGGGLERLTAVSQNQEDMFKTELFWPIITEIENLTQKKYADHQTEMRVIADHLKAAVFIINDGVIPSNKQAGYLLRRLIRRSVVKMHFLAPQHSAQDIALVVYKVVGKIYTDVYFRPQSDAFKKGEAVLLEEITRFEKTLARGLKELEKQTVITGQFAFNLFQTFGFPFELTEELSVQKGQLLDETEFKTEFEKHQELSRTASKGMFKGGLMDQSEIVTKYHTATHLLHEALRRILGPHVQQVGSNLTDKRLRFDFTHNTALTDDEIKQVEALVNQQIIAAHPVIKAEMSLEEAIRLGALAFFTDKYGDRVFVYSIGNYSQEVCGGPHVGNTSVLGRFSVTKQEAVGMGKRRLYAILT